MSHLAEVVTLYEHNPNDVIAMLRLCADNIESGAVMKVRSAVLALEFEDGDVEPFGWGETGLLRSLGLLQLASAKLTSIRLKKFEGGK
jgi:hypothetical protein